MACTSATEFFFQISQAKKRLYALPIAKLFQLITSGGEEKRGKKRNFEEDKNKKKEEEEAKWKKEASPKSIIDARYGAAGPLVGFVCLGVLAPLVQAKARATAEGNQGNNSSERAAQHRETPLDLDSTSCISLSTFRVSMLEGPTRSRS